MLRIITIHHDTDAFVEIQAIYLKKYIKEEYTVFSGMSGIEIDKFVKKRNSGEEIYKNYSFADLKNTTHQHYLRMNLLYDALNKSGQLKDDDVLIFLDGDAFPINEVTFSSFKEFPVQAVSRRENIEPALNDKYKPYPHPVFFATTVSFWKEHNMTWELDEADGAGTAGPTFARMLNAKKIPWKELLRSNVMNIHPLNFAVYGGFIYHHGSGNRGWEGTTPTDVYDSIDPFSRPGLKGGAYMDYYYPEMKKLNNQISKLVYDKISSLGDTFIRNYFLGVE